MQCLKWLFGGLVDNHILKPGFGYYVYHGKHSQLHSVTVSVHTDGQIINHLLKQLRPDSQL